MISRCTQCGNSWTGEEEGDVCPACRLQSALPTAGELYAEFAARFAGSPAARFEALCRRHPGHVEELRSLHAMATAAAGSSEERNPASSNRSGQAVPVSGLEAMAKTWPSGSRFRVEGVVEQGAMSVSFAVRDRELDRVLVMKVLGAGSEDHPPVALEELPPTWVERFVEEARILAQLNHPAIPPVHELGLDAQGRLYVTTRRMHGRSLGEVFALAREGREGWNLGRATRALLQACEAVAHAHQNGVVHRCLTPESIRVEEPSQVYVTDWRVAHAHRGKDLYDLRPRAASVSVPYDPQSADTPLVGADATGNPPIVTHDGTVLGTPAYLSPEHARGEVERMGPRSDVYSLGAILYELLAGYGPYLEATPPPSFKQVLDAVRAGPPRSIASRARNQAAALVAICGKAMERDPAARYAHAAELADDLRSWVDSRLVHTPGTGPVGRLMHWLSGR